MDISAAIEAILFAAGESVPVARLSLVLGADEKEISLCAAELAEKYEREQRGMRILRLEDKLQMCSAPEYAELVTKTLETRKPPKLSPSQLETLTVIAYYQPATKALVEQIRGVDSAYCVSALVTKKLIRECGRLNVPGRPIVYETTPDFLRVFGLESLADLPQIEKVDLHVDPSQIDPIEQKPDAPQTEDQLPAQQEIPL